MKEKDACKKNLNFNGNDLKGKPGFSLLLRENVLGKKLNRNWTCRLLRMTQSRKSSWEIQVCGWRICVEDLGMWYMDALETAAQDRSESGLQNQQLTILSYYTEPWCVHRRLMGALGMLISSTLDNGLNRFIFIIYAFMSMFRNGAHATLVKDFHRS